MSSSSCAGAVVFDGVLAQVKDHLIQNGGNPLDPYRPAPHRQLHILCPGGRGQLIGGPPQAGHQVHRLGLFQHRILVQLRKAQNILYQLDQTLGFIVDLARKMRHVAGRYQAPAHDLGDPGNRGERGLELVGNVGAELPAKGLALLLLGHIHQYQNSARQLVALKNRICEQLALPSM